MPHPWKISTDSVEEAVRLRGTNAFTATALARQLGCSRQTIYKHFDRLRLRGWEFDGQPKLGFMARKRVQP
jgi:biotin operon repressor